MNKVSSASRLHVDNAIKRWQTELLDLTKSNRLLDFKPGSGALPLSHPGAELLFDGLTNKREMFEHYRPREEEGPQRQLSEEEQLDLFLLDDTQAVEGARMPVNAAESNVPALPTDTEWPILYASDDSARAPTIVARHPSARQFVADGDQKKAEALLYKLYLRSRSMLQEQGVNILFVAFGLLDWAETDDGTSRILSPLLLVPVRLERKTALDPFQLALLDDDVVVNPTLARKLETDFQLRLALPDSDSDTTLRGLLAHLGAVVGARMDWRIRPEAHLGLFSFAKYAMYTDLAANRDRLSQHPVIRAIAREEDGLGDPLVDLPSAATLDKTQRPIDTFQVLDADASQQEVIAAVKAGTDLVIQGPPGTGKSQTITNIIAECLAAGKTVLFVSEKITALRVVAARLADVGLKEFCLEAHSQDINKATIVHDLARTLEAGESHQAGPPVQELERIFQLRDELNGYARELHDMNNPFGCSAYAIHGEYAKLIDAPTVLFELPNVSELTQVKLATLTDAVRQLVRVGEVLVDAERHPWRGATHGAFTPQVRSNLEHVLERLSSKAATLDEDQRTLRAIWGLPEDRSLTAAHWLAGLLMILDQRVPVPIHWFRSTSLTPAFRTAEENRRLAIDYHQRRAVLLAQYDESVFALELSATLQALETRGRPAADFVRGQGAIADRAIAERTAIRSRVERATEALVTLQSVAGSLAAQLGLPAPATRAATSDLRQLSALVQADPRPQIDWFDLGRRLELEELAETASGHQAAVVEGRTSLGLRFTHELYEIVTDNLQRQFEEDYGSWPRFLKGGYRRAMKRLRQAQRDETPLDYRGALLVMQQVRRIRTAEAWLAAHRGALVAGFGVHFNGLHTDWDAVRRALETVRQIVVALGGQPPPVDLVETLLGNRGGPSSLQADIAVLNGTMRENDLAWSALLEVLALDQPSQGYGPMEGIPIAEAIARLCGFAGDFERLWEAYDRVTVCRRNGEAHVDELIEEIRETIKVRSLEQQTLAAADDLRVTFGPLFVGLSTDWDGIIAALQWTGQLLEHFAKPLPESFLSALSTAPPPRHDPQAQLPVLIDETEQLLEALRRSFEPEAFRLGEQSLADAPLLDLANWAGDKQENLLRLEEWIDFSRVMTTARELGLTPFIEEISRVRLPRDHWHIAFLRAVYTAWLTWRYTEAPALDRFRGSTHDEVIAQFQELDRWQWKAASRRIAERLRQRRPVLPLNVPPRSEPGILRGEATKKRRFRPLRQLFASLPTLLPALKPCMLMSPLSVAQFLGESAATFDVVVFDEASQILPADAVGAIGRARQAVIVGDQKQLPPTNFFGASLVYSEEADGDEELPESVLDACLVAGLPQKPLLWHYRSRHEDLIAFSNRHFYDGRLITFPSPDANARAVEFVHVADGIYDRGSSKINRVEAARVVERVAQQVRRDPTQSVGVIAFSEAQADAIEFELNRRKRLELDLETLLNDHERQDLFFVKPLEKVQGDERDVIFFSVGYGPDLVGNMTMNFGPLNRQGGERRLNVAVTRARDRVVIFASFRPEQIDLTRTSAKGVHRLRDYLEYAEQGPRALLGGITTEGGDFESPFEEAVANALSSHGLRVVSQVGVSSYRIDLAIRDETLDRYLLGVECDGRTYHSSKTARDRDRLRQEVLEQLGWRIHRIWSTDWIKDPKRETEAVLAAVAHARAELAVGKSMPSHPVTPMPARTSSPSIEYAPAVSARSTRQTAQRPLASPYIEAQLGWQGSLVDFTTCRMAELVTRVQQVVETEGPVHEDRAIRLLAESFGIMRTGGQVRARAQSAVIQGLRGNRFEQRDRFLWPRGAAEAPFRASGPRTIHEIAPEEIAAGIMAHLQAAFALSRADLVTGVAREFGYDRTGSHVSAGIGRVLDMLIANETLVDLGGQISQRAGAHTA